MNPKISVIIPVYGVEKYLQDCIDSLIAQTFDDIEFIFVDDSSPDGCASILDTNAAKYPEKMRVIHLQENRCLGGARNAGIDASRGEYIGFVDSDDLVLPDMYGRMYSEANDGGADVVFVENMRIEDGFHADDIAGLKSKKLRPRIRWSERQLRMNGADKLGSDEINDLYCFKIGGVMAGLWRKDFIDRCGMRFPEHTYYEDSYWYNLLIPYLEKVRFIPEVKYLYRSNPSSVTRRKNDLQIIKDRNSINKRILSELKKKDLFDVYRQGIEYRWTETFARVTFKTVMMRIKGYKRVMSILKEVMDDFTE